MLRRIAVLYAIEDEVRGTSAEQRRAARAERARVIVNDLHSYLEKTTSRSPSQRQ